MSNTMSEAIATAKRIDDAITNMAVDELAPTHCRATTLLAAIRVALAEHYLDGASERDSGLVIDVLHAQCEDWLRRESE